MNMEWCLIVSSFSANLRSGVGSKMMISVGRRASMSSTALLETKRGSTHQSAVDWKRQVPMCRANQNFQPLAFNRMLRLLVMIRKQMALKPWTVRVKLSRQRKWKKIKRARYLLSHGRSRQLLNCSQLQFCKMVQKPRHI
mmetsp:Transcript_162407/g.520485  ORF Transcript_162407/g.520485 Transcript_162407/m.520485 type:complete len:140 (-) Transcript_162407:777-1196(-)